MLGGLVLGAALLTGCAAMRSVSSEVSSFGEWPDGRSGGSYAFERLPSQQAQASETEMLENAARPALAKAGFTPAAAGQQPDVLVQVGSRAQRAEDSRWDERLWFSTGFGYGYGFGHRGLLLAPRWSLAYSQPLRYDREVALLIRDRVSGKTLYETRATNEGSYRGDSGLQTAMFEAALLDFPRLGINPRRVTVALPAGR
jgi:hypothetical protein